jgi:hypothetical protein
MCEGNRVVLIVFLLCSLFFCLLGVLRAEEQPDLWYLISESELRSIEQYRKTSETEKQTLLLQAKELRTIAGNSAARSARLETESANLNRQLAQAREDQRRSAQSFNGLESEWLITLSLKNGEIADWKQRAADQTLKTESYRGKALARLIVAIALGVAWLIFIVVKVLRTFRVLPF